MTYFKSRFSHMRVNEMMTNHCISTIYEDW